MKSILLLIVLVSSTVNNGFVSSMDDNCNQESTSDTLEVIYTYWWPSGGPFMGLCGEDYSLSFTGTVVKIQTPSSPYTVPGDTSWMLYTPQSGIIKIHEIKVNNPPVKGKRTGNKYRNYNSEQYIQSDCFYDLELKEGDKIIAFVYSYEGYYSIPSKSILKIESFNAPIVSSIEKYIQNGQDPLAIQGDIAIWREYDLDNDLKQIIDCRVNSGIKK